MSSAWDCFHLATLELVRSAPMKQRLMSAYRRHLHGVGEDQLPADLRGCFMHITGMLTSVKPLPGEDAVAASVRKMSAQEADDCAVSIVEIFGQLSRPIAPIVRTAAVVQLHSVPALIASS